MQACPETDNSDHELWGRARRRSVSITPSIRLRSMIAANSARFDPKRLSLDDEIDAAMTSGWTRTSFLRRERSDGIYMSTGGLPAGRQVGTDLSTSGKVSQNQVAGESRSVLAAIACVG